MESLLAQLRDPAPEHEEATAALCTQLATHLGLESAAVKEVLSEIGELTGQMSAPDPQFLSVLAMTMLQAKQKETTQNTLLSSAEWCASDPSAALRIAAAARDPGLAAEALAAGANPLQPAAEQGAQQPVLLDRRTGQLVGLPRLAPARGPECGARDGEPTAQGAPSTALAIAAAIGAAHMVTQMRQDALPGAASAAAADTSSDDPGDPDRASGRSPFSCQRALHLASNAAVVHALCGRVAPAAGDSGRDDDGCWGQDGAARAQLTAQCDVGPRAVFALDRSGHTPLHCARDGEVALALLAHGANPRLSCAGVIHRDREPPFAPAGEWVNAAEYLRARSGSGECAGLVPPGQNRFEPEGEYRWRMRRTVVAAAHAVAERDRWVPLLPPAQRLAWAQAASLGGGGGARGRLSPDLAETIARRVTKLQASHRRLSH
jgi:hypothetical protein